MNLSRFIRENLQQIVSEWEGFALTQLPAAGSMSRLALRDHASNILNAIADDIESEQSETQREAKSAGAYASTQSMGTAAATHGALRHASGFTLIQLTAEFRALRATVMRLWAKQNLPGHQAFSESVLRFNEALDQAVAESVEAYESQMVQARDLYLAILGHDLRSPLAAIVGASDLLRMAGLNQQTRLSVAGILESSAAMMGAMINDLIEYSRTRLGGSLPVKKTDSDLAEICRACLDEVRMAHPGVALRLHAEADMSLLTDPVRIRQALSNVLNNAVQHGAQDEGIDIWLTEKGSTLEVRIFNHGPPIPTQHLEAIFDPFRSLSPATVEEKRSHLGLGLFIAREVARAHGGDLVAVECQDGALFLFTLPKSVA
jgi:signal transduction histidine kinase